MEGGVQELNLSVILHAVAEQIRNNNPAPVGTMQVREYILYKNIYEFAKGLDDVANINQTKDKNVRKNYSRIFPEESD